MLAGGVRRLVGPDARLTVHSTGSELAVADYLDDMAIRQAFLAMMQPVKSPKFVQLQPAGMAWVGLTTGPQSAEALTNPAICKAAPRPRNCRVLTAAQ
jgi:hypothetical protein